MLNVLVAAERRLSYVVCFDVCIPSYSMILIGGNESKMEKIYTCKYSYNHWKVTESGNAHFLTQMIPADVGTDECQCVRKKPRTVDEYH